MPRKASNTIYSRFKRAPRVGALFICSGLVVLCFHQPVQAACVAQTIAEYATVRSVVDGDTLRLSDGRKVRLIGVNTPETAKDHQPGEPYAVEARAALLKLAPPGSRIGLQLDDTSRDRHGRTLAHVFTDEQINIAESLIERGYAMAIAVPPNLWQHDCYFTAEARARQQRVGLWRDAFYEPRDLTIQRERKQGFQRVRVHIKQVTLRRTNAEFVTAENIRIFISKKDRPYFDTARLNALSGKNIVVRGWLRQEHGQWQIQLRHPAMLSTTD